jgi:hypothetical protein
MHRVKSCLRSLQAEAVNILQFSKFMVEISSEWNISMV